MSVSGDPPRDQDLPDLLGNGDDGIDLLYVFAPTLHGEIHPPGDNPDGNLGQRRRRPAHRNGVGIMEVGEDTAAAPHRPGQLQDGHEVHLALHAERQNRKPVPGGLLVERGIGLDDKIKRVAFLLEFAGQEKSLTLAAPPLASRRQYGKGSILSPFFQISLSLA